MINQYLSIVTSFSSSILVSRSLYTRVGFFVVLLMNVTSCKPKVEQTLVTEAAKGVTDNQNISKGFLSASDTVFAICALLEKLPVEVKKQIPDFSEKELADFKVFNEKLSNQTGELLETTQSINALTKDYQDGKIDKDTYQNKLKEQESYIASNNQLLESIRKSDMYLKMLAYFKKAQSIKPDLKLPL